MGSSEVGFCSRAKESVNNIIVTFLRQLHVICIVFTYSNDVHNATVENCVVPFSLRAEFVSALQVSFNMLVTII